MQSPKMEICLVLHHLWPTWWGRPRHEMNYPVCPVGYKLLPLFCQKCYLYASHTVLGSIIFVVPDIHRTHTLRNCCTNVYSKYYCNAVCAQGCRMLSILSTSWALLACQDMVPPSCNNDHVNQYKRPHIFKVQIGNQSHTPVAPCKIV